MLFCDSQGNVEISDRDGSDLQVEIIKELTTEVDPSLVKFSHKKVDLGHGGGGAVLILNLVSKDLVLFSFFLKIINNNK